VIQSFENPNVWKLTDFGISVFNSGYLMATRDNRGTAQYTAPEIICAQPGVPTYKEPVDVYGIGLILYELLTGCRAISLPCIQFPPPIPQLYACPHIPVVDPDTPPSTIPSVYATSIVSSFSNDLPDMKLPTCGQLHADFWGAVKDMEDTDHGLLTEDNWLIKSRLEEINILLYKTLDDDPQRRLSIKTLEHHFRVNFIRSMLENDTVYILFSETYY
jgi:serine/threonine protein kinase